MSEEMLLSEEQNANILKFLHALRVLHFPEIEEQLTHVEIKYVNSSGVDEIINFLSTDIEKLRKMARMEKAEAIENVDKALASLQIL
jgi:hypothetical protein